MVGEGGDDAHTSLWMMLRRASLQHKKFLSRKLIHIVRVERAGRRLTAY